MLELSDYSYEQSYLTGICFFSNWYTFDVKATGIILAMLHDIAPPVFRFFFMLPNAPTLTHRNGYQRRWLCRVFSRDRIIV